MKERILDYIFCGMIALIVGIAMYNLSTIAIYTQKIYELLEAMG